MFKKEEKFNKKEEKKENKEKAYIEIRALDNGISLNIHGSTSELGDLFFHTFENCKDFYRCTKAAVESYSEVNKMYGDTQGILKSLLEILENTNERRQ